MRKTKHDRWSRELKLAVAVSVATLAASWVLGTSTSWANPMMSSEFFAQQVPGTHHVQVTWLYVSEKVPQVTSYLRDNKSYAMKWKLFEGFKANLGSGVSGHNVSQACDCNLPLGKHSFRVVPKTKEAADYAMGGLHIDLDVVANKAAPVREPKKPGPHFTTGYETNRAGMGDEMEAEGPLGPQGLDCKVECASDATAVLTADQPKETAVHRDGSFKTGGFVLEGKYVRPPYDLVLDDYQLTVNGKLLEKWEHFSDAKLMLRAFDLKARQLRQNTLVVRCMGNESSMSAVDSAQMTGWLKKVDSVLHEKIEPLPKLMKLGRDQTNPIASCSEQVLQNWDGYQ